MVFVRYLVNKNREEISNSQQTPKEKWFQGRACNVRGYTSHVPRRRTPELRCTTNRAKKLKLTLLNSTYCKVMSPCYFCRFRPMYPMLFLHIALNCKVFRKTLFQGDCGKRCKRALNRTKSTSRRKCREDRLTHVNKMALEKQI